jgi:hypothetical protein
MDDEDEITRSAVRKILEARYGRPLTQREMVGLCRAIHPLSREEKIARLGNGVKDFDSAPRIKAARDRAEAFLRDQ